jgi:predicted transposase/invertase (TIGR01784 family)
MSEIGTPYDDVFRTLLTDCSRLIIPVVNEIFQKKLLFLIPFYIFTFEHDFGIIENNENKLRQLKETYADITRRLEALSLAGELDAYTKQAICEMSAKVLRGIAYRYEKIKKEVAKVMGGEVLEYPAKTFLRQGIEQGKKEGKEETAVNFIKLGKVTLEEIADATGLPLETVKELEKQTMQMV